MTFGSNHYVPVLKVKRGEKAALRSLAPPLFQRITPLLEIVERRPDKASSLRVHLDTAFKDLAASAAPFSRVFLDAREIAPDGAAAAQAAFDRAAEEGMSFTPVTGVNRNADVAAALAHSQMGVALRLTRQEFEAGGLNQAIHRFLSIHGLAPEALDLIVDLGAVDDMVSFGVMALADAFLAEVPFLTRWRTLTVSGCAFPATMGGIKRNAHGTVERSDWLAWRDGLFANRNGIPRLPAYSDCVIQHPSGVEGFDPRTMAGAAAIRYTAGDAWLLIKGESTRNIPPSGQFPQLAEQLVYGPLSKFYSGAKHCSGCASIKDAADGAPKHGSLELWRRLGTIHHLHAVMDDLAALPWP